MLDISPDVRPRQRVHKVIGTAIIAHDVDPLAESQLMQKNKLQDSGPGSDQGAEF